MNKDRSKKSERAKKIEKTLKPLRYIDYTLLFIILFLLAFGLIMVYSTSAYMAGIKLGDQSFYFRRQMLTSGIGLFVMVFLARVDYRVWKKLYGLIYFAGLMLCILVAIPGIGIEYNGSRRWLGIGPFTVQPSEIAKIAVLIFVAAVVSNIPKGINDFKRVCAVIFSIIPIFGLVAYTNLSNGIIIMAITIIIIFVASKKYMQFFAAGGILVAGGILFITMADYRMARIQAWLHPEDVENGYQTLQGLYAIGSGGLFGKGLGNSMQKLGFVPEAQNDMIFSIICEELGLFGAISIIILFLLMIWRLMVIAVSAKDLFGSLIAAGVMGHIATQVILNIAVVTNTIPNTGISLPFISYGGTSVIFLLAEMGLALSVARGIKLENSEVSS